MVNELCFLVRTKNNYAPINVKPEGGGGGCRVKGGGFDFLYNFLNQILHPQDSEWGQYLLKQPYILGKFPYPGERTTDQKPAPGQTKSFKSPPFARNPPPPA